MRYFALKFTQQSIGHSQTSGYHNMDSLSKRTDWAKGVKKDNENKVMLKNKWLEIRAIEKRQLLIEKVEKENREN